jgi:hypothetical protein
VVVKVESEFEYMAGRMKKLEADCLELREQVEALTREKEKERLRALPRDEGLDEYPLSN